MRQRGQRRGTAGLCLSVTFGMLLAAAVALPNATPAAAAMSAPSAACMAAGVARSSCSGTESASSRVAWAAKIKQAAVGRVSTPACGPARPGYAQCFALEAPSTSRPTATCATNVSYTPCDLQSAYALPSTDNGRGRTVAIVDAYDDPVAASDLNVYRNNFGLPACTTASGCFRKVDQTGGNHYPGAPPAGDNWILEISLDIDMVSAICPNCHILLVEASSEDDNSLFFAENEAAKLGATEISNSWGGPEFSQEKTFDSAYFNHPGVAITAATGDGGYGVAYPAASPLVTAVGGTSLSPSGNARGWDETAWSGAGSGCSQFETPRPAWQGTNANCANRADADVSADADPGTGVFTYDSDNGGSSGWNDVGGTSVASPIVASVYALTASSPTYSPSYLYSHAAGLNDVTTGSNGSCGNDLCNAETGWDGPTGLGTPNGISAFGIGPAAVITAVRPTSGPVAGGQTVTVDGSGFEMGMTATIGGMAVTPSLVTFNSFTFPTPSDAAGYVQIQVTTSVGASALTAAAGYVYVGLGNYTPRVPFRIVDTRPGHGNDPLGSGTARTLQVSGAGTPPIPASAVAVVLNVTEVDGSAASLLTVYPTGTLRPNASNLNFGAGTVTANLVTATLGQGGSVTVYNALGSVNYFADVEGYFGPPGSNASLGEFHPITPLRVCDTRPARIATPCSSHGALVGGTPMLVNVTGSGAGAIPNDGTAEAAVLNLTGVTGSLPTYISVYPTTSGGTCALPGISTLNILASAVQANRVMVQLGRGPAGPNTSVCAFAAMGKINVLLDANGWFGGATAPAGAQYEAMAPSRICDTRVTSAGCSPGAIGRALSRLIGVAGEGGVPALGGSNPVIVAAIANLTAIVPTQATYLTLYPSEPTTQTPPNASDLNVNAGATLPNLAVVQLDTNADARDGFMSLYNAAGSTNAVIDLEGWFQ